MTVVQTVTGPIDHTALGVTLCHEHLALMSPALPHQYPWLYDRAAIVEHVSAELVQAREAGVGTIVDVSPPDLGRDVRLYEQMSRRSGVAIIACTGIWMDIPRWFSSASTNEIADVFIREIEVGIADTEIRAGVIKVANSRAVGIGEVQERVLRAAGRAATHTGVPVTTHTSPYDVGLEQMRIFDDEGVPPHLTAIGHALTGDVDYLGRVLESGRYVSIDQFKPGRGGEDEALAAIATLCAEGYSSRILLSHDHVPEWDWRPHPPHEGVSTYCYVPTEIRSRLIALGVSSEAIDDMLIAAPASFLSGGRL